MRLLFGHEETVTRYVAERTDRLFEDFEHPTGIGVINNSGALIAGAVYHGFKERYGTLEFSGAAISPLAFTPGTVRAILSFPFLKLAGINRIWAQTSIRNLRAQKLLKGVGFQPEAVLNSHLGPGHHARLYRLLKSEWEERYQPLRMAA